MAAPAFVGAAATSGSGTSVAVTSHASVAVGDFEVAVIHASAATLVTPPSGWLRVPHGRGHVGRGTGSGSKAFYYYRIRSALTGGGAVVSTFTLNTTSTWAVSTAAFSGVDEDCPFDTSSDGYNATGATNNLIQGMTTYSAEALIVAVMAFDCTVTSGSAALFNHANWTDAASSFAQSSVFEGVAIGYNATDGAAAGVKSDWSASFTSGGAASIAEATFALRAAGGSNAPVYKGSISQSGNGGGTATRVFASSSPGLLMPGNVVVYSGIPASDAYTLTSVKCGTQTAWSSLVNQAQGGSANGKGRVCARLLDESDCWEAAATNVVTAVWSNTWTGGDGVIVFSNCDVSGGDPTVATVTDHTAATAAPNPAAITVAADDSAVVSGLLAGEGAGYTVRPTGYTESFNVSNGGANSRNICAYKTGIYAGSEDPSAWTTTSQQWISYSVVINGRVAAGGSSSAGPGRGLTMPAVF